MKRFQPLLALLFLIYCPLQAQGNTQSLTSLAENGLVATQIEAAPNLKSYVSDDLFWAYNTLLSVEEEAILIAANDQEACLLASVQKHKNVKTKVQIMSASPTSVLFKQLKIKEIDEILESGNPIFLTLSVENTLKEKIKHKSYITGLTVKVAATPFDNLAVLKQNVEQHFLLDYLTLSFENEHIAPQFSIATYFVPFSILYRHYKTTNEVGKMAQIKNILTIIAAKTNNEAYLTTLLDEKPTPKMAIASIITVKNLEKPMVKLSETLYVSDIETTNGQYNLFLQDLLKQREFDKIALCKTELPNWKSFLPKDLQAYKEEILFQYANPDSEVCPAQNMSYEAAVMYCEWITAAYNNSDYAKKKFKKVLFRLPSETEWQWAARGKAKEGATYPWSDMAKTQRTDYKNLKGCYLANFNLLDPKYDCKNCRLSHAETSKDGGFFPVRADAYFPNDIGLYNTSGNVAEMINEKGKAKGGSWQDIPEECTIKSIKMYNKPSAAVGFRVFMEILEQ